MYVPGDVLSRATHAEDSHLAVNVVEFQLIRFDEVIHGYEDDQFVGPIIRSIHDEWLENVNQRTKPEYLQPLFKMHGQNLISMNKTHVSRKCVSSKLDVAHDSRFRGHLKVGKPPSRLRNFHWRHKEGGVRNFFSEFSKL